MATKPLDAKQLRYMSAHTCHEHRIKPFKTQAAAKHFEAAYLTRISKLKPTASGKGYIDVLPPDPMPAGLYLVHNHVTPYRPIGTNGFRAWIKKTSAGLTRCRCDFGKNKNYKVHSVHYRGRDPYAQ